MVEAALTDIGTPTHFVDNEVVAARVLVDAVLLHVAATSDPLVDGNPSARKMVEVA